MVLARTQAPGFQAVSEIRLPAYETFTLDNNVPVYLISVMQQPVVRLEIILDAGSWYEQTPSAAFFAVKMLTEGTKTRTSAEISEYLDNFGAFLELNSGPDRASIVVYCLTKYLGQILTLMQEVLTEPVFPEKELEDLRNITLQNLRVSFEKNAYIAGVRMREKLFGNKHPYGRMQQPAAVEAITRADVAGFFENTIRNRPFRVLLAGHATPLEVEMVNKALGQIPTSVPVALRQDFVPAPDTAALTVDKAASVQSSVRLGRLLFTREHPDFIKMLVTNEVFGGYFGSRLMKNIREDKGFTYGISSSLISFRHEGFFTLGTDVKKENTQQTLDEVAREVRILQTEPVTEDELETVKNFMAGEFVGSLNTPFEIADRYKVILLDGMPDDFLNTYIPRLRSVTAAEIMQMANQYLDISSLTEIVVGGK